MTREALSTLDEFLDAISERPEPEEIDWDERYAEQFDRRTESRDD